MYYVDYSLALKKELKKRMFDGDIGESSIKDAITAVQKKFRIATNKPKGRLSPKKVYYFYKALKT